MSAQPFAQQMAALPGTATAVMLNVTMDGPGTPSVKPVTLQLDLKDP